MPYQSHKDGLGIPGPSLNGGLYTGESFPCKAPWANVPVTPDASYMIHENLRSANPPPGAIYQYPSGNRPGNNTAIMPGVEKSKGPYNLLVVKDQEQSAVCNCYKCSFNKYHYL